MNKIRQSANKLKTYGRNGDTLLAHITPEEANLLKSLGGAGTINPATGLPEFWGGFGGFFSSITNAISDVLGTSGGGGGILGTAENVVEKAGNLLAEGDKFVNREVPGGWVTVGLTAVGAAAYTAAADAALAAGATTADAAAAGAAAAEAAETAALLDAAALAEGGTTAGMGAAANTGLPFGTETLGGTATGGFYNYDVEAQPGGFYGGGEAPQATIIPGELGDIILDASGNVVTSSGADILAAPSSFSISPGQALQGLRMASGLLSGRPQQPQIPQMQMGGRTQMPQGAVDYSGLYNLLALQRARNPNSLLG